jgi:hypothetical protein
MKNNNPYLSDVPTNRDALYPCAVNSPLRPGSHGKNSNAPLSGPEDVADASDDSGSDDTGDN